MVYGLALGEGHLEGILDQSGITTGTHRPADNAAREEIQDHLVASQIQKLETLFSEICGESSKSGAQNVENIAVVVNVAVENQWFLSHLQRFGFVKVRGMRVCQRHLRPYNPFDIL